MAAVPPGNMRLDPEKAAIGSLRIIREMPDYARHVDEALEVLRSYNVDMQGGPLGAIVEAKALIRRSVLLLRHSAARRLSNDC